MKRLFIFSFLFLIVDCSNQNKDRLQYYKELFQIVCKNLNQCSVDTTCNTPGEACFRDLCDGEGPVCIKPELACLGECGSINCTILESHPAQISCNNR